MAKILLVDDDPGVRASLADVLSERGYDVAEATDGNDGLKVLRCSNVPGPRTPF